MNQIPDENATNTRDKLIRELYFEQKGLVDEKKIKPWDGPLEERLAELKKKTQTFVQNLKKVAESYKQEQEQLTKAQD